MTHLFRKIAVLPLILATPAMAQAPNAGWTVSGPPAEMKKSLDKLTVTYSAVPNDDDAFTVVIRDCNGQDWTDNDVIHFDAQKRAERLGMVHDALHDMIVAGAEECGIGGADSDSYAEKALEGLDAAYTQFGQLKK